MGTLPPPSKEQKSAIDAISSGHCVTISSVAGSGKTTCILQIAASLPEGKKVTIVTYNRALSDECKERIVKCRCLNQ
jgi:superfamily II DNA or RNA helicase